MKKRSRSCETDRDPGPILRTCRDDGLAVPSRSKSLAQYRRTTRRHAHLLPALGRPIGHDGPLRDYEYTTMFGASHSRAYRCYCPSPRPTA
jgi:hypothetical protein